jgi:hypothetical protein
MPFLPAGVAQTLNVSDTATNISISSQPQCRIYNRGPNACRVRFSTGGTLASSSDTYVPKGLVEVFTRNSQDWLSAICASGESAVLEIMPGSGD